MLQLNTIKFMTTKHSFCAGLFKEFVQSCDNISSLVNILFVYII